MSLHLTTKRGKSVKQAVARAKPKTAKHTGVVPHSGRTLKIGQSKPITPNNKDKIGSMKSDAIKIPIDTGAKDTPAMDRLMKKKLPKGARVATKYKPVKRSI